MGASEEDSPGHASPKCVGIPLPLLPVQADIPTLSRSDEQSSPDGASAGVCDDLVDTGFELSGSEHNP